MTDFPEYPIVKGFESVTAANRITLPPHPRSQRFMELLEEIEELHLQKSADYGTSEDPFSNVAASTDWGIDPWVGVMIRLTDKVRRLVALHRNGSLRNESAEDSFRDIAAYSLMACVLYEEMNASES